ncbi:uncharacterized protein DMAD_06764 [Drosophila madeirensis]
MAASIYATPPPDLSSEDTALSDVSNSSTLNTNRSNNNNTHEATAAAAGGAGGGAAAGNHSPTEQLVKGGELEREPSQSPKTLQKPAGSSTNEADNDEDDEDVATEAGEATAEGGVEDGAAAETEVETEEGASNMAAMAAAAANAAAMQLQLLEALSDAAKKRRKQHNPSRLEALNLSGAEAQLEDRTRVDYEEKLSKMFLPKSMEKLKETFELLQQHKQEQEEQQQEEESEHISEAKQQQQEQDQRRNPYQTYCKQCGENFETEFKLSLHMLQDHREGQQQERDVEPMDFLSSIKVKLEREESPNQLQLEQDMSNGHGREQEQDQEQEHWYNAMAQQQQQQQQLHPHGSALGPAFPFPPGMGPAGYLPLLGMSGFPGVDGLNRPPLRIFNPEAYCELCNKEFCNKYFLKTHKANKHGIFDPVGEPTANSTSSNNNNNNTTSSNNNSNSGSSMSHMFQLQREAAAAPQPPPPPPPAPSSVAAKVDAAAPVANIHCDICSKRFTNIFAMRRHRAKQHEQAAAGAGAAADSSPNSQGQTRRGSPLIESQSIKQEAQPELELQARAQPFQLPEGFREDFTLEQEELNFVPPPRKLPAQLQQQARECASSAEKLRRLGVHFPEFYCELCHKEYANRYFLRTHKWKRHGVFVPPEDLGKDEAQLSGWPFMPLNLMLAKAAAAASMEQAEQEHEQEAEQEPEAEQELSEQPSKRIKLEPDLEEEKLNGSSVMGLQNLQKLQSMLQQLNDINGKRPLPCHLCGRELENQYALRAHLMTEHAAQMQLPMGMPLQLPPVHGMSMPLPEQQLPLHALYQQQAGPQTPPNAGARSSPGSGEEFKQHIAAPSASPLREGFYTPERPVAAAGGGTASGTVPVPPPNRPAYTITPTSSYCEICNKELCNKYFMKTHMQRMHGIEIENGAQIGGVVCNICNKELCSKYFLRVHKHNTHGIIEEGSPLPQPRGQNGVKLEAAAAAAAAQQAAPEQELTLTPPAAAAGESNSGAAHEVCPLCARQFRSFKWLRSHLMNEHGPAGVERLREMEAAPTAASGRSKPNSPTLKIPNGSSSGAPPASQPTAATAGAVGNPPPNLAQALQNLNAQHLFGQMQQQVPKGMQGMPPLPPLPGMFGEQSQRFKEYQCSMCPFTTPYYAFLFIHERSHALLNSADGMEASLEAPPPPPAAARSQGKSRSKSSRATAAPPAIEDAELHVEPTNLSTSKATTSHSPTQHTPGTPSPKAQSPLAAGKNRSPNPTARRSSKSNTPNGIGGGHRSAATSPFEVCTDLANGTGKPASYAQPDRSEEAYQMQAFHLQPADADSEMQFAPALVYLPVRVRASESATLSFRLTPA